MASSTNTNQETKTEIIGYGSESVTVKPPIECLEECKQLNNKIMKSVIVSQLMDLRVSQRKKDIIQKLGLDKIFL